MATTDGPAGQQQAWQEEDDYLLDFDDNDSLASIEDDEPQDHPPEEILAEFTGRNGHVWYLVKWLDCPFLWSSWECGEIFTDCPEILEKWKEEKKKQAEGKSTPLDIGAFNKAVLDIETAERQRRTLRRLKRRIASVLDVITLD